MRLGMIPANAAERDALDSGAVPVPFFETHMAFGLARAVMVAKLGVFESLTAGPATAAEIATRSGTDPAATHKLLTALAGCGYLEPGDGRYALSPMARTWLVLESLRTLVRILMFAYYLTCCGLMVETRRISQTSGNTFGSLCVSTNTTGLAYAGFRQCQSQKRSHD